MVYRYGREDYSNFAQVSETIPEDEPIFLLRAQDVHAADAVRYWADLHEKGGGDPRLCDLARMHAALMDRWPVKKIADLSLYADDVTDA